MKLHPEERKREITGAILSFILFCLPLIALVYFMEKKFEKESLRLQTINDQSSIVLQKNKSEIEEIRIIQGNQEEINATWDLLNSWNQGAIEQLSAEYLTLAGFHSVAPLLEQTPGIPNQGRRAGLPRREPPQRASQNAPSREYTQIKAESQQSEYLRIISALSKIEENENLTQIERLTLTLPKDSHPYQNRPTYLDVELILATPNTIR